MGGGQFCRKSWILASGVGVGSRKEELSQSMFPCHSASQEQWMGSTRDAAEALWELSPYTGVQPGIRCPHKTGMRLIPSLLFQANKSK